jgi:hypothetical protein
MRRTRTRPGVWLVIVFITLSFVGVASAGPPAKPSIAVGPAARCDRLYEVGVGQLSKQPKRSDAAFVKARLCYEAACAVDVAEACLEAGRMYAGNRGGVTDGAKGSQFRTRADKLFAKRCRKGDGYACAQSALALFRHELFPRSLRLNRRACALGSAMGCKNLGFSLTDKRFGKPRIRLAIKAYRQACKLGPKRLPGPMQKARHFGCTEAKDLQEKLKARAPAR